MFESLSGIENFKSRHINRFLDQLKLRFPASKK